MPARPVIDSPTQHAEVNTVLRELMEGVDAILGSRLVGAYLYGSLTSGEFDRQSDIDVLVVTRDEISEEIFAALAAMHARSQPANRGALTARGRISRHALRRYNAATSVYPHLDRGKGEAGA